MADQQLNIKLNVIDNASRAFSEVKNSIFNVRNALIGLGAGLVVNSLINIGREADNVSSRLNQVAKAGYGGSQAFDQLTKFAIDARIPLLDVFQASNDLLSVSKSPEELAKNLIIASNASARFKISFVDASDQVAKSLLKGVDSARLFQDRGIKSLKGFGEFADKSFDGVGRALERNFGANGVFGTANKELKDGLAGTIIALDNRFKQFQITVAQSFFDSLTKELGNLVEFLEKNDEAIDRFAKKLGDILGKAVVIVGYNIALAKKYLDEIILGFQILIALKVSAVFYDIAKGIIALTTALTALSVSTGYGLLLKLLTALIAGVTTFKALDNVIQKSNESASDLNNNLEDISSNIEKQAKGYENVYEILQKVNDEQITFLNVLGNVAQKNLDSIKNLEKAFSSLESVSQFVIDNLNKGITAFSRGVAESIVLGKDLEQTFRKLAQETLVNILSSLIELIIRAVILKSIFKALGLPIEEANENSKNLKNTSFEIFGINTANYGIQVLTTSEIAKQNDLLRIQASIPRNNGGGGGNSEAQMLFEIGKFLFMAEGGALQAGQPAVVGERGRELFIPSTSGTIVPNHDMGSGGNNITFNIQANDVRGIKELLIDNRATIINLVNQGANQKGKSNVV